jgi:GNAT superfamily N-acetyltransferase
VSAAACTLRDATPHDITTILRLVRALAAYEKLLHEVDATEDHFHAALFGEPARAHAILAELDGEAVGFGLWFYNFSTFSGRPGLYIEDVYVEPDHRGRGIGKMIFRELARRALAAGCSRMQWSVLDWNQPAIEFYRSIGARPLDEWTVQRLSGNALVALAI